ncbi:hypothetical protein [Mucilaginibacter ginkgonis]|uniref:Uncharacterized protein n=1 Tax=Mucilaginibacter ginkgonis TaxID=2682091 RepID=A0A6I4IMS7_9SPHI|nr:hypothetical protein [Mucilaginibacter ginkgonis]QQL50154.1 hypothetical protein GO620_001500 [Mucilaginibacter ginkgonis]
MRTNTKMPHNAEKIAASIAKCILNVQWKIASILNHWFNAYSTRQKKIALLLFWTSTSIFIAADTWRPFLSTAKISQYYNTAHIGQASDFPFSKLNKRQLTDSLTIKSQLWKQH